MAIFRIDFDPIVKVKKPHLVDTSEILPKDQAMIDMAILHSFNTDYELGTFDVSHVFEKMRGLNSELIAYADGRGALIRRRDNQATKIIEKSFLQKDSPIKYQIVEDRVIAVNYWRPNKYKWTAEGELLDFFLQENGPRTYREDVILRKVMLYGFPDVSMANKVLMDLVITGRLLADVVDGKTYFTLNESK